MINQIAVVGLGYVGLSLSILLSQRHKVIALDIDKKKVELINSRKSPLNDKEIEEYLANKKLNLIATLNKTEAYKNADCVIIATPTDYDNETGSFNTHTVEKVISEIIELNNKCTIVIKSTVPIGFTDSMKSEYDIENILYSPEFLRESRALYDNLYPSRIIVGETNKKADEFANILLEAAIIERSKIKVFKMSSKEAESIKLFSNTYLAMRVAFFNELDSFSEVNQLDTEKLINGVCSDPRIGDYYNNPSFGYGGYCLPKDTQQLLVNFKNIPNEIIKAVIKANSTRKEFIASSIILKHPKTVGIFRLIMKENSDNFRDSAVLDVIKLLLKKRIKIIVYEPILEHIDIANVKLDNDLENFKSCSDLIIANRESNLLKDVLDKVYSRDIFNSN